MYYFPNILAFNLTRVGQGIFPDKVLTDLSNNQARPPNKKTSDYERHKENLKRLLLQRKKQTDEVPNQTSQKVKVADLNSHHSGLTSKDTKDGFDSEEEDSSNPKINLELASKNVRNHKPNRQLIRSRKRNNIRRQRISKLKTVSRNQNTEPYKKPFKDVSPDSMLLKRLAYNLLLLKVVSKVLVITGFDDFLAIIYGSSPDRGQR